MATPAIDTPDNRLRVAQWVRSRRLEQGLTLDDVPTVGISRSRWVTLESYKGPYPKRSTLIRVANRLGRDPNELLALAGYGVHRDEMSDLREQVADLEARVLKLELNP